MSGRSLVGTGRRIVSEFSGKNVTFMAAGIAYNALVSLAPLLILLLFVVTVVGGGLEDRLVAIAGSSLPGPIADAVGRVLTTGATVTGASLVSLVVLVWGTLKLFRVLDTAFSEIYETEDTNSLVDQVVDGVVVLVALVATVGVITVVTAYSEATPFAGLLTPVVLLLGLTLAFFPMYYRFPDADLGWRDALPGAVVAAVGWAALQGLFRVYLVFGGGGTGEFFGGVLVVVTWLYFSGLVLLLGAVLNAVLGGHATSAPGGVGRGARGDDSDAGTRRSMDPEDLSSYLRDLREQLTGRHEELAPGAERTSRERRRAENVEVSELVGTLRTFRPIDRPDDVEVVERSWRDGDGRERAVTIRWRDGSPED